jgi:hypothetical protein
MHHQQQPEQQYHQELASNYNHYIFNVNTLSDQKLSKPT